MTEPPPLNATLLVFEATPKWLPLLRRLFLEVPVRIEGVPRPLADSASANRPVVRLIRLAEAGSRVIQDLAADHERRSATPPLRREARVAIAERADADLEWILRDLGLTTFLHEPLSAERVGSIIRRHWRRLDGPRADSRATLPTAPAPAATPQSQTDE